MFSGYDCATPICVQAETFTLNVDMTSYIWSDLIPLGGHGKDGKLPCDHVKCPEYDAMVIVNNGRSFQTGCGNDPIITGCCYEVQSAYDDVSFRCLKCNENGIHVFSHSAPCPSEAMESWDYEDINDIPASFKERGSETLHLCGPDHNPGGKDGRDYYVSEEPFSTPYWSNRNYDSTSTSDRYLCNRHEWTQGDFLDEPGLAKERGIGADMGSKTGRHTRVNYDNYIWNEENYQWESGQVIAGEGIFACYNGGSCIAPDVCTCRDGYTGFDCKTPLCRHRQVDGTVVGCLNGGICLDKDMCNCIHTESILWMKHEYAERGITGWTGQDCSTPMCSQGFYDPICADNPESPGGEGCYRCTNGGLCIAPDVCECSEGWTGFDCQTPVCEAVATLVIRKQLMTADENKIRMFEKDPCGMKGVDTRLIPESMRESRGKCTLPNECTCLCRESYNAPLCRFLGGKHCTTPFQDTLRKYRNVLAPNEIFGTRSCSAGYEGAVDDKDKFKSCHLTIYEPRTYFVRNSISIVCWGSIVSLALIWNGLRVKRRRHTSYMSSKFAKRRSRREELVPNNHAFAFGSKEKDT